jgi:hypothetical protein
MSTGEDRFRAAAAECLEAARKTADLDVRATLPLMAQRWLELADGSIFGRAVSMWHWTISTSRRCSISPSTSRPRIGAPLDLLAGTTVLQ